MDGEDDRPGPIAICGVCGWLGLAFGLVEGLLGIAWRRWGASGADPDLWLNWHAPWMAPVGLACGFALVGIVTGLLRTVAPRIVHRLLPRVLVGLGAWSALGSVPGLHRWAVGLLAVGLAVRLGGRARLDRPEWRRFGLRASAVLGSVWLVLALVTGAWPATREARALARTPIPPAGAPNVLLVVLDTVRADNLGAYGYGRPTSPRFDARCRDGVRFAQARATAPFTLGTHASLFTGRWMSETSAGVNSPLDAEHRTLAEHLRDRGYATGGFVGNLFYGSARYGLDRGFLRYRDVPDNFTRRVTPREIIRASHLGASLLAYFERKWRILDPPQRRRFDAREVNREALAWIDETRSKGRPFFAFVNYFDAHSPYSVPADVPRRFGRLSADRLEERLEHRDDCGPADAGVEAVGADVRDAYDDGIAWIDRQLDDLLAALDRRGLLDDTLVVITADHGEMLGEHGLIGHGNTIHRPVVHVPLLVLGGRGMGVPRGTVVERPVSLRDVPATVLDLLDDPGRASFPGTSLARCWEGRPDEAPTVLTELEHMPWQPRTTRMPPAFGPMWLITAGPWSYHRQDHETLGRRESLYDLSADPGEQHDLAADPGREPVLRAMRARLDGVLGPM